MPAAVVVTRQLNPPHKIISITRITPDPIFAMPKPRPRHLKMNSGGIHGGELTFFFHTSFTFLSSAFVYTGMVYAKSRTK